MTVPTVMVIGGAGFYGRYVVDDLLKFTGANVLIVGRNPPSSSHLPARVQFAACDMNNFDALKKLMANCQIVIHCAGPFQTIPLNPLKVALQLGIDYIDLAEPRIYLRAVRDLKTTIQSAKVAVLSGLSVSPAMEALFLEMFRSRFEKLHSIRTFAAPDTRKHRGPAMFETMLYGVGRPFSQPSEGASRVVHGWTEGEWAIFPPPIGRRLTYLVLEMADLDLLPELFEVQTVEFKAGTEWDFLNRLLGLAARIRVQFGWPDWEKFISFIRAFSWLIGRIGMDEGGVIFEVRGKRDSNLQTDRIAVIAQKDGGLIPSVLAGIAAQRLLDGRIAKAGLIPLQSWIKSEDLIVELERRGLEIWWHPSDQNGWEPFEYSRM